MSPVIVEIKHVDSFVPVNEIGTDKEIAICGNTSKIVFASIFESTSVGNTLNDGVGVRLRMQGKRNQQY
jgi:hypothetical protein